MKIIILILISAVLNCAAQLFMKKGMIIVGEIQGGICGFLEMLPVIAVNLYLWTSVFCYVAGMALWLVVLSKVEVSYAYPFLSIGYILTAISAHFLFHEAITPIRMLGIFVICLGVILISRS